MLKLNILWIQIYFSIKMTDVSIAIPMKWLIQHFIIEKRFHAYIPISYLLNICQRICLRAHYTHTHKTFVRFPWKNGRHMKCNLLLLLPKWLWDLLSKRFFFECLRQSNLFHVRVLIAYSERFQMANQGKRKYHKQNRIVSKSQSFSPYHTLILAN